MALLAIALSAVFLTGVLLGAFLLVVVGIHVEERRMTREEDGADTRSGAVSRRVLGVHGRTTALVREDARR